MVRAGTLATLAEANLEPQVGHKSWLYMETSACTCLGCVGCRRVLRPHYRMQDEDSCVGGKGGVHCAAATPVSYTCVSITNL